MNIAVCINAFSRSCAKCTVAAYKLRNFYSSKNSREELTWNCEAGRQRKIILLFFRSKLYYKLSVYAWETLSWQFKLQIYHGLCYVNHFHYTEGGMC